MRMKTRASGRRVQRRAQRVARNDVAELPAGVVATGAASGPIATAEADAPERLVLCRRCGKSDNPPGAQRCLNARCQGVLAGNQIKRRYPKPATEDPAVQRALADEAARIVGDRGGRGHLSTIALKQIDRLVVLGLFLQSWEQFFLSAGIHTKHGRVRSGYVQGYLRTLDSFARLAQQVGVSRESRRVPVSTRAWLEGEHDDDESRRDYEHDQTGQTSEPADSDPITEAFDGSPSPQTDEQ